MDLRTRYTALVTLTTQHVKYISDALRRLEEEEVRPAFTLNYNPTAVRLAPMVKVHPFICAERGGGGEAGQGGAGFRAAGLVQRSAGSDRRPQRGVLPCCSTGKLSVLQP